MQVMLLNIHVNQQRTVSTIYEMLTRGKNTRVDDVGYNNYDPESPAKRKHHLQLRNENVFSNDVENHGHIS